MGNDVRIRLSLTENVSKQLRGVSKEFDKLGGRGAGASLFGNVGARAVAKGFDLISGAADNAVGFLEDSVRQAREAEVSEQQLATALQNNVKYWDGSTAAIEDQIDAKLRLGFADDVQRRAMTLLITATGSVTEAQRELTTAMDVARYKNISLEEATTLVIRATHGNTRALKDLGIQMPKNSSAAEILAAINTKLTGTAERYANTLDGKVDAANARLQKAQEALGKKITPLLADALTDLTNIFDYMSGDPTKKATGSLKFIQDNVTALQRGVDRLINAWNTLTNVLNGGRAAAEAHAALQNTGRGSGFGKPHAAGGWVGLNGPEIGLLGENGPEYIIPNDRLSTGRSSAPGVMLQGVSARDVQRIVDEQLWVTLKRAGTGS